MKTLLPVIVEELTAGRAVALATVLQSKGSAPRGAGACQLLLQSGRAVGTVGGGILERRALDELQVLLKSSPNTASASVCAESVPGSDNPASFLVESKSGSFLQEYALTQDDVQSLGMVCGGNVTLLYQLISPAMLPFFRTLSERLAQGQNLWLVRNLEHGTVRRLLITDGQHNPTAIADDTLFAHCHRLPDWFTLFGPANADIGSQQSWFVEPISLISHAYIFGCGHVAQCVAPLLAQLDFAPIVYDDRPEFATPALFPTAAEVICAPFAQAHERLHITADDEIVIMTRGHVNDLYILSQALRTPAYYIGLIGSRSKIAHTKAMLLELGFSEADFARVKTPIGLPIAAETPMEIAVSVAAEMILCRARYAEANRTRPQQQ